MHTNYGGHGLSGLGDIATFPTWTNFHVNRGGCQMCAHQFWWVWPLQFWRYRYSQKQPIFPLGHGLQSMVIKKFN